MDAVVIIRGLHLGPRVGPLTEGVLLARVVADDSSVHRVAERPVHAYRQRVGNPHEQVHEVGVVHAFGYLVCTGRARDGGYTS